MKSIVSNPLAFPILALACAISSPLSHAANEGVPSREDITEEIVAAEILEIDLETREVTLGYPGGYEEVLIAGDEVKRLDEFEVGDYVVVQHVTALGLELRAPTAEELAEPLLVVGGAAAADDTEAPAGALGTMIRAVCTVEVLDRLHGTGTVMGPNGNLLTIRAEDPENLTKVRIGDTVVVTYTEAVVMSLEKVAKPE